MSRADVARSAAVYALAWTLSAAVGVIVAGVGVLLWVLPAYLRFVQGEPTGAVVRAAAPGVVLVLLGLLVFKVASTVALYRTLGSTVAAETAGRLDTEAMKSDILSVLDERLADMHQDTRRTRRIVERERSEEAADEFEFPASDSRGEYR